ncbi:MAG: cytochrome c biogenesis protein CcsA [Opitutae bacterium]|nr:cytochrome c biogenesis protein CcsA [Opitutae bacterium]
MKKYFPYIVLTLGLVFVAATLAPTRNKTDFDLVGVSQIPVLVNGRIKPLDTVARTSLLVLQGRQRVVSPDGRRLTPIEWLLDVMARSELADTYQTIEIVHPDVLALFNLKVEDGAGQKRFSYNQIKPRLDELEKQARLADSVEGPRRSTFQKAVLQLYQNLHLYGRLKYSLVPPDSPSFLVEIKRFQEMLPAAIEAAKAREAKKPYDEKIFTQVREFEQRFDFMAQNGYLLPIPAAADDPNQANWKQVGRSLLETFGTGSVNPNVMVFAGLAGAWQKQMPKEFNEIAAIYREQLAMRFPGQIRRSLVETRFNSAEPFYVAAEFYVAAFLLAVFSWLKWPDALRRSAFWLMTIAFALTTAGILARMWLEARPPVTNLYSSALFVGWAAVVLCLVLEGVYKNAIGSVAGGFVGFCTLLIAHHLALGGDTMEMMRAVLDSNFWLATHVVTITVGYGATYLAGLLGLIYIIRGVFTPSLDSATAGAIDRMVYGIVCFATFFSFVGTVLGGIWGDQAWGRFWGWDPKENGALIIVVWNAIILHARWGGLVKQRGLMCLAVFGNIVTSWSWFGVNMLGVGLHSYGFMDQAFWWLLGFILSQLALIAIAGLPLAKWRSFAGRVE